MQHPKHISIEAFDYPLADERIARFPLEIRDSSQLLIYRHADRSIQDEVYRNIGQYIPAKSQLVFNNTRVVQARLHFQNRNGRTIEIFCLEPVVTEKDITLAMAKKGKVDWVCLVGGAKKWKEEHLMAALEYQGETLEVKVSKLGRNGANFELRFEWSNATLSFSEVLEMIGKTPLPPYMKRDAEASDKDRYQTVFAEFDGSVAAPTSGLHFTENLLDELKERGFKQSFVTLHVGAGTFKPVSSVTLVDHDMHFEYIQVQQSFIEGLIAQQPHPVIPVGTTSMRTLESLYWLGVKCILQPDITLEELVVNQWDPYELPQEYSTTESLQGLLTFLKRTNATQLMTRTQLMIAPGYTFRIAKGLITNFHQPKSTLLLLVSAITGNNWRAIYDHALDHDYRFLSYGDGCLLLP